MDPFNDNLIAIACDDGKVVLHDIRESSSTGDPSDIIALGAYQVLWKILL